MQVNLCPSVYATWDDNDNEVLGAGVDGNFDPPLTLVHSNEGFTDPTVICQLAAMRLRRLADAFEKLSQETEPLQEEVQEKLAIIIDAEQD